MLKRSFFFVMALILALGIGVLALRTAEPVTAQTFGTGTWTANYYDNTSLTGIPVATTTYPALNLSFAGQPTDSLGNPLPGVPADNFSARFTSTQTVTPGNYTFTLTADDRVLAVTINGAPISQLTISQPNTTVSQAVAIQSSTINIQVDFVEFTSVAILQLQWAPIGGGGVLTPTPLGTPTFTPPPTATGLPPIPPGALTATVIRAAVLNVRAAPSIGAPRLGRILRGQTYAVVGRDPDARWFLLQLSGFQGWAYGYYLFVDGNEFNAPIVSGNAVLGTAGLPDFGVLAQTEAGLRLRAEPTTNSTQIGRIDWGAFLPVVGRTAGGSWWQVVWKGTVGWVFSPFLNVIEGDVRSVPITR
ncbi:MAG: SH3 domain-containing protein [Chloroflexota bacterium]